jgi:hypothetical protein
MLTGSTQKAVKKELQHRRDLDFNTCLGGVGRFARMGMNVVSPEVIIE